MSASVEKRPCSVPGHSGPIRGSSLTRVTVHEKTFPAPAILDVMGIPLTPVRNIGTVAPWKRHDLYLVLSTRAHSRKWTTGSGAKPAAVATSVVCAGLMGSCVGIAELLGSRG